ncbi:MAG TPA: hypothetical protein VMN78_05780 [Longimicrobiales bacterium]|nr:hypothetical protein [Longimicrobiales bacterium]
MRTHTRAALALLAAVGLALPLGLAAETPAPAAEVELAAVWQGQGRGNDAARGNQGRGNDEARGNPQAAQGRANETRGNPQAAQGRGNREERGSAQGNRGGGNEAADRARGRSDGEAPGRSGRARARRPDRVDPAELRAHVERLPAAARRFTDSSRRSERLVGLAIARASVRGTDPARFRVESDGSRVRVRNQDDDILLDMSEARARELGHWEMRRLGDRQPTSGSPAFCRSGAGHPVWGKEWCLQKEFGLGVGERSIWSRATIDDVVFERRPEARVLDRGGLIDVLGDIVFGRLAVQSLALGYQEPLVGRWVVSAEEPDAPWILRLNAGDVAVAEFLDTDRDGNVEVLYVTQPRW